MDNAEALYPMWRWHLWESGFGSYDAIEAALCSGTLKAFTCPKEDCDCKYPKAELTTPPLAEPPPLKWDIINSTMRIAKGKIERGEDAVDILSAALVVIYDAGHKAGRSEVDVDVLVDEVQHRMDQVVEAAVEWHQAGQEDGDWFEAVEKLGAAINSLLELRDNSK